MVALAAVFVLVTGIVENNFGTVILKLQRNGNLESSDFVWSNSKTPYDETLKLININNG